MGSVSSIRLLSGRRLIKAGLVLVLPFVILATESGASSGAELLPDAHNPPAGESLYLEVVLNQMDTGRLAHVIVEGQKYYMPAAALQALSFKLGTDRNWVRLDSLPGVRVAYDEPRQKLRLTVPLDMMALETRQLNQPATRDLQVTTDIGALLNYDVFAFRPEGGETEVNSFSEFRFFGDWGLVSQTQLAFSDSAPGRKSYIRLETAWRYSDPDDLTTLQVGDGISRNLSWTRATRFGGIQWRRNFALQPDLIVYPLPEFSGRTALPSTVELYVNGVRQFQDQVAPGPFEVSALPSVNQQGQATLVVTDSLGRQTVTTLPVYTSSQLLQEGFTDYSVEVGYVRQNFGIKSLDYGDDLMSMATVRHGLSEYFTLEGHAEASDSLVLAGGGAVTRLDHLGIFSASLALSRHDDEVGRLTRLAYEWQGSYFGINLDTTQATSDYRDVASLTGLPPARRADRAFLSLRLGDSGGAVTAGYVRLKSQSLGDSRFASLFYSLPINRKLSLFASLTEDLDDEDQTSVFAGLNYAWGGISYALSASRQGNSDRQSFQVNSPVPIDGGFGWRALAERGPQDYWQLESGYRGDYGQINGGVSEFDGTSRLFANLSGAVVAMDHSLFLSRQVSDAFALVSSNGVPGVPVLLENRKIGLTDDQGYYLLTPLSSYQANRVSIDPADLPEDVYFGPVERQVVPAERAGAKANFGLRRRKAVTLVLDMPDGSDVPVGSRAYLNRSEKISGYVGYDGQLYLQGLQEENDLRISLPEKGECSLEFDYVYKPGTVPTLGPMTCE